MRTDLSRLLPSHDSSDQKCGHSCLGVRHLPQLCAHLLSRDIWCLLGREYVCSASDWAQMGHGRLFGPHGNLPLPLRHRQHAGFQCWPQRDGIFLPKHVQRGTLRMDPRGFPCANQRHSIWSSKLLGPAVQHRVPSDCCASAGR